MKYYMRIGKDHERLMHEVKDRSGVDLRKCYQCGECTAGCPITPEMDAGPARTLRLIQLGMEEEVFALTTPWLCASCETCTTRCPNDIDIALVMDVLRQMARIKGTRIPAKEAKVFQDVFLDSMRLYGKLYEPGMMAFYNLRSGHLFHDVQLGPSMLFKGKLPLIPHRSKNRDRVRDILERAAHHETQPAENPGGHGHGSHE